MKIATISTLLSIVSLGAVIVLYVKVDDLRTELRLARSSRADVSRGYDDADDRARDYGRSNRDARDSGAESGAAEESHASMEESTEADGTPIRTRRKPSYEERLAKLEERMAKGPHGMRYPGLRVPRFARSVKDLSKRLKLTQAQEDRVNESVQRGKDRIDAILAIPGPDGKSPKEARAERRKKLEEAVTNPDKRDGLLTLAMPNTGLLNQKIPGRNETYREEIARVKTETRDEVNSALSPEQQKEFEGTNIDPLLGGGGTTMTVMTTAGFSPDGTESTGASIVVEEVDDLGTAEPEDDSPR
ncbi:MAG: hypothetical protein ACYTGZ_18535 [Planctomycetota bacterium]